jgi:hypothetical protein
VTTAKNGTGATAPVLRAANPADVRSCCPRCGSDVVSNCYRVAGRYEIYWECVGTLCPPEQRTCDFRILFPTGGEPIILGQANLAGKDGTRP